jgi:hypothetical protein
MSGTSSETERPEPSKLRDVEEFASEIEASEALEAVP